MTLQTELDLITTNEAERLLLHSRSRYFEHGTLLAHQLRRQVSHLIARIKDGSDLKRFFQQLFLRNTLAL